MFKHWYRRVLAVTGFLTLLAFFGPLPGGVGHSQELRNTVRIAVSDDVHQHVHSIALSLQDISNFISEMGDNDTIAIESSSAFDGGTVHGAIHTHTVILTKSDLIQLQNTGTLTVQSEYSLGHRHTFRFINPQLCPVTATPSPTQSPSPTPSPSVSPTESPTVSPSVSPSVTPSASASPEPIPSESGSPSPAA